MDRRSSDIDRVAHRFTDCFTDYRKDRTRKFDEKLSRRGICIANSDGLIPEGSTGKATF